MCLFRGSVCRAREAPSLECGLQNSGEVLAPVSVSVPPSLLVLKHTGVFLGHFTPYLDLCDQMD